MRKILGFLAVILFVTAMFTSTGSKKAAVENTVEIFNGGRNFVAHRGASYEQPENTIPAFEMAGTDGFWGIETDVSETSDGEFVCMHDETIDRTTNGSGMVGEYSLKQIMKFDIDAGNNIENYVDLKIPKLSDYLDICKKYDCVAVVEIKIVKNYKNLIKILDESGCRCIITGGIDSLREVRKINKSYPLMIIGYAPDNVDKYIAEADTLGTNCGLLLNYPMMDENAAKKIEEKNYYSGVWTVSSDKMAAECFDKYGVDFVVVDSAEYMK